VDQKDSYTVVGYYVACSDNSLPTFRDILLVPFSRLEKVGLIGFPETSVRDFHYSLCYNPEGRISLLLPGGSMKSRKCRPIFGTVSRLLFLARYFFTLKILTNHHDAFIKIWITRDFAPLAAFVFNYRTLIITRYCFGIKDQGFLC
jgi:hypothetical protein